MGYWVQSKSGSVLLLCVSRSLRHTHKSHTPTHSYDNTHTDLEAVDELISDFLADWRASPAPRRARLRWWRRWLGCTSYDDGGREDPVCLWSQLRSWHWEGPVMNKRQIKSEIQIQPDNMRISHVKSSWNGIHNLFYLCNVTSSSETGYLRSKTWFFF